MISKNMVEQLRSQANREMYSAYLYLGMALRMKEKGYFGIGNWLMVQYHEEMFHALKLCTYLLDQGASCELKGIAAPNFPSDSVKSLFQLVLTHEQEVTKNMNDLYTLATTEKDYATQGLLQWYINEQIEEEKNVVDILQTIDLLDNSPAGLFMLNIELGKRSPDVPLDFTKGG